MNEFKEIIDHIFRPVKSAKRGENLSNSIEVNDLRIVKLYSTKQELDDNGKIVGMETRKFFDGFVLLNKKDGTVFLTEQLKKQLLNPVIVKEINSADGSYQIVYKKMRRNDRYRKPIHLFNKLENLSASKEVVQEFAENLSSINSNLDEEDATNQLVKTCENFYKSIQKENLQKDNKAL